MHKVVHHVRKVTCSVTRILECSVDSTPEKALMFFKTGPGDDAQNDRFMGITVPVLRKIAKSFMTMGLEDLGLLIQSKINEERLLALVILTGQYKVGQSEQQEEIYQFYRANMRHVNGMLWKGYLKSR